MNRRFAILLAFACFANGVVQAQDKPATPKVEKATASKTDKTASTKTEKPATSSNAEKPAAPKVETPATPKVEKPKVLIFEPPLKSPVTAASEPAPKGAAASPTAGDGPVQVVSTFFGSLQEGKIDEAYATLTKGSKIAEKPEELRQLKTKTREAVEFFGAIHGYDLVEWKVIGNRLVRSTYVSLGKVFPLRWRFYFYKPDDVWRLIDLRVDDKLTGIFDETEESVVPEAGQPKP